MFNFFKKKAEEAPAPAIHAEGTEITYDNKLIDVFHDEHRVLLDLFGKVSNSAEQNNFDDVKVYLAKFTKLLRAHLLKENLKLYLYLQHALVNDKESQEIVHAYRHEMQGIGKAVNAFVTKYRDSGFDTPEKREEFKQELAGIGPVLVERISNEENILYPLYNEPTTYH